MGNSAAIARPGVFGTTRRDAWWISPLAVFLGLSGFVVYATWAGMQNAYYWSGPYLSPFYSPEIWGASPYSWLGPKPDWWPVWLLFSPAFVIIIGPLGFRLTCYYYRGAYYKAFWADPVACTVGEPRKRYMGEASLPLIVQNIHRYFLYLALAFLVILAHDVWRALWFVDPASGREVLGLGIGTLVLAINVFLLGGYTFGCHSLRHLIGGGVDCLSRAQIRRNCYTCVSFLNARHMTWAWFSLFWVGFADFYVRMCAMGLIADWRIL